MEQWLRSNKETRETMSKAISGLIPLGLALYVLFFVLPHFAR